MIKVWHCKSQLLRRISALLRTLIFYIIVVWLMMGESPMNRLRWMWHSVNIIEIDKNFIGRDFSCSALVGCYLRINQSELSSLDVMSIQTLFMESPSNNLDKSIQNTIIRSCQYKILHSPTSIHGRSLNIHPINSNVLHPPQKILQYIKHVFLNLDSCTIIYALLYLWVFNELKSSKQTKN